MGPLAYWRAELQTSRALEQDGMVSILLISGLELTGTLTQRDNAHAALTQRGPDQSRTDPSR